MSAKTVAFVRSLVERFPRLVGLLDEHIEDNFGEILPHLFFGDLTRYVVSLFLAARDGGDKSTRQELRAILDFLEQSYASADDEVQELISVSFLEHLPRADEDGYELRKMVGRNLLGQLRVIG